jgi:hypothetical protein
MSIFIRHNRRVNILAPTTINGIQYNNLLDPVHRELADVIEIPEPPLPTDYSSDLYNTIELDVSPYLQYIRKEQTEIDSMLMTRAKMNRTTAVSEIVVTTSSGKQFDGNEDAQNRMARAIVGMTDTDTIVWVLADNTPTEVNKAELLEALKLSGIAQATIWITPYQ